MMGPNLSFTMATRTPPRREQTGGTGHRYGLPGNRNPDVPQRRFQLGRGQIGGRRRRNQQLPRLHHNKSRAGSLLRHLTGSGVCGHPAYHQTAPEPSRPPTTTVIHPGGLPGPGGGLPGRRGTTTMHPGRRAAPRASYATTSICLAKFLTATLQPEERTHQAGRPPKKGSRNSTTLFNIL